MKFNVILKFYKFYKKIFYWISIKYIYPTYIIIGIFYYLYIEKNEERIINYERKNVKELINVDRLKLQIYPKV